MEETLKMWYKNNFFKYATGIILCLIIIFLFGKVQFFLDPFKKFVATLFFPILISGLFYYILRPIVRLMVKYKIPRTLSIVIVLVISTILFVLAGFYSISLVVNQLTALPKDIPNIISYIQGVINSASTNPNFSFIPFNLVQKQLINISQEAIVFIPNNVLGLLSTLTSIATTSFLVPFIVFFMLKDDHLLPEFILKFVPSKRKKTAEELLEDIDKTLSAYIVSQVILSLFIGILMYIGYTLAGLNYSFILALFAAITNLIPIVGAAIGVLPAVMVGLPGGVFVILKILIAMAIVQTIQGNVISPLVMGKSMSIHPMTYIVIFLATASVYGLVGLIIAIPVYAVLKVIIAKLYSIYRLRKEADV